MTLLATLRHQQRNRARTVLGLLVVVFLNLTLQGCAIASPDTPLVDRPVASSELDSSGTHSSHAQPEQCPFCEHERCAEGTLCDGPVTAGTKAETRLPETHELESTVAASINDLDLAVTSPNTCLVRPNNRVTATAVPLTVQFCVYLI